jgi:uncharacterized protein
MSALYELQFNVAQLLKEATGARRSYEVNAEIGNELDNATINDAIVNDGVVNDGVVVSPFVGQVEFLRTGPNILVTGLLKTTIQKTCGRCLTNFTTPVSIELEEEFYPIVDVFTGTPLSKPPQIDQANLIDEQNILDLSEVVRQELAVISDGIFYCRPDCQGLCPHCGQDRNVAPCNCQEDRVDPRWAGLQALQIGD